MSEEPFDKPRIAVNRVYTRGGDGGETGLAGGQRLAKGRAAHRILRPGGRAERIRGIGARDGGRIGRRGSRLWRRWGRCCYGCSTSCSISGRRWRRCRRRASAAGAGDGRRGGAAGGGNGRYERGPAAVALVRVAGRRQTERGIACVPHGVPARGAGGGALARVESVPPEAVRYLNRLSDALFRLEPLGSRVTGAEETLWEPNQSASGLGGR